MIDRHINVSSQDSRVIRSGGLGLGLSGVTICRVLLYLDLSKKVGLDDPLARSLLRLI